MTSTDMMNQIRQSNLSYLLNVQAMVRTDVSHAIEHLGVTAEAARWLAPMSHEELLHIASSNDLMCRFFPEHIHNPDGVHHRLKRQTT